MLNHKIRSKAIRENWSLDRILTETALDEQTAEQAGAINKKVDEETSHERVKKIASRKTKYQPNKDDACGRCGNSEAQHMSGNWYFMRQLWKEKPLRTGMLWESQTTDRESQSETAPRR